MRLATVFTLLFLCSPLYAQKLEVFQDRGIYDDAVVISYGNDGDEAVGLIATYETKIKGDYLVVCYYTSFNSLGEVTSKHVEKREYKTKGTIAGKHEIMISVNTVANRLHRKKLKSGREYLIVMLVVYKDAVVDCSKYRVRKPK